MFSRSTRLIILLAALALGAGLGYLRVKAMPVMLQDRGDAATRSTAAPDAPQPLAGTALGGAFTLTDQDGTRVTEASWPGQYLLIYFGFTHCPDICPLGLGRLTDTLNMLPADIAARVQPLFVTIDPARDDAAELKKYVTLFHPKLQGLTGTPDQIAGILQSYRVYAQREDLPGGDPENYMMNHSSYTYLVAPAGMQEGGRVIDVYAHDTAPVEMARQIAARIAAARP